MATPDVVSASRIGLPVKNLLNGLNVKCSRSSLHQDPVDKTLMALYPEIIFKLGKSMPELFFKKMVILGKNDSTSEKDTVEVSAVKLVDLKIENKLNFPVSLKKIKPKEIEAIDDFLEEGNLVIFDIEDWEKILKKLSIQS